MGKGRSTTFEFSASRVKKYGKMVWRNGIMDELRQEQCLCFNCGVVECKQAKALYCFCKKTNMAMAITRCPNFIQAAPVEEKARR